MLENDANAASHLKLDFDAQWNDDGHHVLHVLLTGESDGYYCDYAGHPAARLARCLQEGFVYQGEASVHRGGKSRGTYSADLPPSAFVLFLQNHDQIGNRAMGDRLTTLADAPALEAAIALQLLCPQIPLIFMGEESASRSPFLYFTDHNEQLAEAVREGRRREFAHFPQFSDPQRLAQIPEPNAAETFNRSKPISDPVHGSSRERLYRHLLTLRQSEIVPRLAGARAEDACAVGAAAVFARWRLGDGAILILACNLGKTAATVPQQTDRLLFSSSHEAAEAIKTGRLESHSTVALLTSQ